MTVRIGEVKAQLQAACDNELPAFITQYEGDERGRCPQMCGSCQKADGISGKREAEDGKTVGV